MTGILMNPGTWILISSLCVLGIFWYMGLLGKLVKILDSRCEGVAQDLKDAEHELLKAKHIAEVTENMRDTHQQDLQKMRILIEQELAEQKRLQQEAGKRRLERKHQENRSLTLRMKKHAHASVNVLLVKVALQSLDRAMTSKDISQSLALLKKTSISIDDSTLKSSS